MEPGTCGQRWCGPCLRPKVDSRHASKSVVCSTRIVSCTQHGYAANVSSRCDLANTASHMLRRWLPTVLEATHSSTLCSAICCLRAGMHASFCKVVVMSSLPVESDASCSRPARA